MPISAETQIEVFPVFAFPKDRLLAMDLYCGCVPFLRGSFSNVLTWISHGEV